MLPIKQGISLQRYIRVIILEAEENYIRVILCNMQGKCLSMDHFAELQFVLRNLIPNNHKT